MSVPNVAIEKIDFQTGSVAPSPVGVLAIIAPALDGPENTPTSYTRDDLASDDFGPSPLVEDGSYALAISQNPVVLVRPNASQPAAYSAIDTSGMVGTTTPTAGTTPPADRYSVTVTFLDSGTVGASGLRWTIDLGGGPSAPMLMPVGSAPITLTAPDFPGGGSPGVSVVLSAGTVGAGGFLTFETTPPATVDADLAASLEALRVSTLDWEALLIEQDIGTGTVAMVDTWLSSLESVGKFKMAFLNTRLKAASESESAFATAMQTLVSGSTPTIRASVGTDGGDVTSTLTGVTAARPTSLIEAARCMAIPLGVEPAYVNLGPLGGVSIVDLSGQPSFHNEQNYPNLDQLLLTTLRSVPGKTGAFITNGRIFSTVGSDYVLVPHVRTMNRACELAYAILTGQLSRGVGKKPKDPKTGKVFILESDALAIEGLVNETIRPALAGQVQDVSFALSRDDDIGANSGAILTGAIAIVSLAYVKGFRVLAGFSRSIAVAA
jgi:hypothetical protein